MCGGDASCKAAFRALRTLGCMVRSLWFDWVAVILKNYDKGTVLCTITIYPLKVTLTLTSLAATHLRI